MFLFAGAALSAEQAASLKTWHRAGQTFITWKEVKTPLDKDSISCKDLKKLRSEMDKAAKVRYRIYRSTEPIETVDGLKPIAEVRPLTCWNAEFHGIYPKPHHMARRYAVKDGGDPAAPGTGIYVHNPAEEGKAFYAVTISVGGTENKALGDGNRTRQPLEEQKGQGEPVFQREVTKEGFHYVKGAARLRYYVRWEAPPNCAVESKPYDYLVAIPPKEIKPRYVGLHLHCWGGSLEGGYAWWGDAEKGALLVSSNQIPYDWWTGYHELYWQGRAKRKKEIWQKGVVHPYSTTRMLSFLDWVATKWEVDLTKTFVVGNSMGGSGSLMFAIRHPERLAYCRSWVGVHIPARTPRFKGSYEGVYGKVDWGVKFADGTPVWDYYSDAWYLRRYPKKEIGFLSFSNGKDDGAIGWPQAVEFLKALQETKRPHLFMWGMSGHGQRVSLPRNLSQRVMAIETRTDLTLPAFMGCSLDSDPGTATKKPADQIAKEKAEADEWNKAKKKPRKKVDVFDGDPSGQINLYLYWETDDLVDSEEAWEMTVGLIAKAPKDECTVDVTPRRRQKFKPEPGAKLKWTNKAGGREVQSGEATVDENGLFTLDKVKVTKGKNRISVKK